jgi:ketosteroid isomerase-like protein
MRTAISLMLLACAGTLAGYGQSSESDAKSKLFALENVWNQAAQGKDLKALQNLLDDSFVYVDSSGRLLTKTEVLASVRASPALQVLSESMVVHVHGDTAVVTGIYQTKGVERGKSFIRRERFIDTWRCKNGSWMSIASLTTPLGS